jgi:3',5'-cyclic AMP phosphodiesterase CpdA
MPSPETGGAENMWYSFNHKNAHFVNIDTETDFPNSPNDEYAGLKNGGFGNQMDWLRADLAKANASRAAGEIAWIFVAGHRPVYSMNEQDAGVPNGASKALQAAVEAMFNFYGVDIYFCGHVHSYERQWPTVNNVPQKSYNNPTAPVYIVNGAGGNIEGVTEYNGKVQPDWNVQFQSVWGIGELTIHNASHVQWEFFEAQNSTITDEMWLVKH